MLNIQLQEMIFNLIPASITIDGVVWTIQKTLGETPLNNVVSPTVNLSFVGNNTLYYRSFDNNFERINESSMYERDIRSVLLRYKCGALDQTVTHATIDTMVAGKSTYDIKSPTIRINSITTDNIAYTPSRYTLNATRNSITWIDPPATGTSFTINYDYICSGYSIANSLIEYIIQSLFGTSRLILNQSQVSVLDASNVNDISKIYDTQSLTVLAVDVKITYPFKWTLQLPDPIIDVDTIVVETSKTESTESEDVNVPIDTITITLR